MSTAGTIDRSARGARAAPLGGTRTIRVTLIQAGKPRATVQVPAGTTSEEVAATAGVQITGHTIRSGPDPIDARTPLEVDTVLLVAPNIEGG